MEFVYHVSEASGIKEFVPREFWHTNFGRSGPVHGDGEIPPGAEIMRCFYASSKEYSPFYYAPQSSARLYVWRRRNPHRFDLVSRIFGDVTSHKILFMEGDRSSLEGHTFYVYTFDASEFSVLPNGEYVSDHTVFPIEETERTNALKHLVEAGYQVEFVDDLPETRRSLLELGLVVDSEGVRIDD